MTITQLLPNQAGLPSASPTASYWFSQPSTILHGHRTTTELPPRAHVIVIGSGITGAFAARALKHGWARDHSVIMLEAREACSGATGRNGGHCQPSLFSKPPHVCEFELRNFAHVASLVADNKIQCGWKECTGANGLYSPDYVAQGRRRMATLEQQNPRLRKQLDLVERHDSRFDDIHLPEAGAVELQYNAATLWPYHLVSWILEDLLKEFGSVTVDDSSSTSLSAPRSFNLQTNTPVVHLQKLSRGGWVVHTPRGQITAPIVLLATNGYTSRLLPAFTDVIVPTQGQVAALIPHPPSSSTASSIDVTLTHTYGFWGDNNNGASAKASRDDYLAQSQLGRRELIYGGGRRFSAHAGWGVSDDSYIDPAVSRFLRTDLLTGQSFDLRGLARQPDLNGQSDHQSDSRQSELEGHRPDSKQSDSKDPPSLEAMAEWTGIMGYSRDWLPWVGSVPRSLGGDDGLWICAGYTGHGMPVAPLSAKAVVDMMGGRRLHEVDLPSEFYCGDRCNRL